MPDVVKHGWTHRPRSQGGTDPIEVASGSDPIWAAATSGPVSCSDVANVYQLTFSSVYESPNASGAFEAADVTAGRADWLQLNEPGFYEAHFNIQKAGGFPDTNGGFIYPIFELSGGVAGFTGNLGAPFFEGSLFSPAGYMLAGGGDFPGLWQFLAFNWDPANPDVGSLNDENPLKIGVAWTEVSGDASYTFGGGVYVRRVGDPGFVDISP